MYLFYLVISIGLTIWVASTLSRNGLVRSSLAVGFHLLNLGYVAVAMRTSGTIADASEALESLSVKVGLVLLVLASCTSSTSSRWAAPPQPAAPP